MVDIVIDAHRRSLGGFDVGRVLPFVRHRAVGPFVFFDHLGPLELAAPVPPGTDVRPHPHIGLATITYLFAGEITHRDSTGVTQAIRPGEVNWMTAGRGITHSERFDGMRQTGGALHGLQAWVALPKEDEEIAPTFDHYAAEAAPSWREAGVAGRLIAGAAYGLKSPVKTRSQLFYVHAEMAAGARLALPDAHRERAAYVVTGAVECDSVRYEAGRMLVFAAGEQPSLQATAQSTLLLIGGEPLGERHLFWNFVSSSKDRLEAAKADWRAGRFPLPPNDDKEFIPLPPDPPQDPSAGA